MTVSANRDGPSLSDLIGEARHLSRLIDELVDELRAQAVTAAQEDCNYRAAYSGALLTAKAQIGKVTNAEAEAQADLKTINLRVIAKVAEANADTTKQALMARRSQLSALQSIASAMREEMAFSRTGPTPF